VKPCLSSLVAILVALAAHPVSAQFLPENLLAGNRTRFSDLQPADINSDGYTDLLGISNAGNTALLWYLNDGNGHFPPNPSDSLVLESTTTHSIIADFNGDGFIDLGVSHTDGNNGRFVWYAGDGQGHFVKYPGEYADGLYAQAIYAVDIDVDGDPDLLLRKTDFITTYLQWVANDGDGNFSAPQPITSYNDYDVAVFISDLNYDGKPDVVLPKKLAWHLNYSAGSFTGKTLPAQAENLLGIEDMDADGDPDLIVYGGLGTIFLLRNTPSPLNATFSALEIPTDFSEPLDQLFTGDFDGDGDKDLIYNGSTWIENDGTGQFTPYYEFNLYNFFGQAINGVDMNGDGREESLFFGDSWAGQVGVSDQGRVVTEVLLPEIWGANALLPFDFDGDEDLDLVVAADKLYWFSNEGGGQFGPRQYIANIPATNAFQFADIDGDADLDIFTQYPDQLLRNLGFGFYAQPAGLPYSGSCSLLLHDFDTDGDIDLLGGYLPVTYLENVGNGNFAAANYLTECSAGWTAAADLDGDADLDLAMACDYNVSILQNDGAANFSPLQNLAVPAYARHCWWADLDGSGKLDVVVATESSIGWFPRLPDGSFDVWRPVFEPDNLQIDAQRIHLADLDGDGDVDMVATVFYFTVILKNDGTGNFLQSSTLPYFFDLVPFDVDGDRDLDLLFAGGVVGWYENVANESFIGGACYWDKNENKQRDPGEPPSQNQILRLEPAAKLSFTDADGNFRFYADSGSYILSILPDSCWTLSTDSTAYHFFFDGANAKLGLDFGLKLDGTQKNLETHFATAPTRCGFQVPGTVSVHNRGCALTAAVFELQLDSLVTFVSASPPPDIVTPGLLVWQPADTLLHGDQLNIYLILKIAGPEHLGDTIRLLGITRTLDNAGNPETPADSIYLVSQINCSYDPNDKLVDRALLPENYQVAASELVYTIRFQNTGTDTAFNITVRDRLAAELDWTTFRPLSASHPFSATLDSATRTAVFSFKNILLPDSNVNEVGSHGLLQFAIYPVGDLPPGTIIENQAGIYFDFNPPVMTNFAETRVQTPVSTQQPKFSSEKIRLWPNPSAGEIFLQWNTPIPQSGGRLLLRDLTGRLLRDGQLPVAATHARMDLSDLPPGFYLVELQTEARLKQVVKVIKSN